MLVYQTWWCFRTALYLFLGGLSSGLFLAASALLFCRGRKCRHTIAISFWLAVFFLIIGLLLLLSELIHPDRAFNMVESFSNGSSWMMRGAWGLVSALGVFAIAAFLATNSLTKFLKLIWRRLPKAKKRLRLSFAVLGCCLALYVACYTGLLLMDAQGVPFWHSPFLPVLFVVSAIATGSNAVALIAVVTKDIKRISRHKRKIASLIIIGALLIEFFLLVAYLICMANGAGFAYEAQGLAASYSIQALLQGRFSLPFWLLVVMGGIVAPLALSAASMRMKGKAYRVALIVGASLTVVGECALRTLILYAGIHADYVGATLAAII